MLVKARRHGGEGHGLWEHLKKRTFLDKSDFGYFLPVFTIEGTASVVLAGLLAALKVVGGTLADHTYLFLGAGEAGTGIAELIALEMSKQTGSPIEEGRPKIWLMDSKGLIVASRIDSLQAFKKPWAHEPEPVATLLEAVQSLKPTVLISTSGKGCMYTSTYRSYR
ncbi:unnamed protein product [Miscanthus lutarioriparius]|uniref:Malic enzyme NAD-binding domain-containing protein n=1 Tax=Miscanthus lutarioriparius TaxID=422564 RepID=A0A811NIB8_9POAL|nr:unnamed protein product [Miscanthus lutarioriparius]